MSGGDHEFPFVPGERSHRSGVRVDQGLEHLRQHGLGRALLAHNLIMLVPTSPANRDYKAGLSIETLGSLLNLSHRNTVARTGR